jgi:hypothetical protein
MSLVGASQEQILQAQGRAQQAHEIAEIVAECTERFRALDAKRMK